jgi:hypothetical protein
MFKPVTINNVFTEDDIKKLSELVKSGVGRRVWYDDESKRHLFQHDDLENYFSKKLEPIAKKIFGDETLKTTFSLYAKYDAKGSYLSEHVDQHACVYTLDYCLSTTVDWPLTVDGVDYSIGKNGALAFMGMESPHGRQSIPDSGDHIVEMVFFHFVPKSHWYFEHCKDFRPEN